MTKKKTRNNFSLRDAVEEINHLYGSGEVVDIVHVGDDTLCVKTQRPNCKPEWRFAYLTRTPVAPLAISYRGRRRTFRSL